MATIIERIEFRKGLETELAAITPASGEPCWTTDTKKFFIGDGETLGAILIADTDPTGVAMDAITVHGADVPSTGTLDLDSATGDLIDVTGTTAITGITLGEGLWRTVRFTGVLNLTHGASLVLPGGATIQTASGDFAMFRGYAGGVVRCVDYVRASGRAVVPSSDLLSALVLSEVSITAGTTLTTAAFGKMHVCTGTSADYTVDLPAVSGNAGKIIGIRMAMALTKLVTVDANSTETIDGATTRIMWAGESAILLCNGTEWVKIAGKSRAMYASSQRTTAVTVLDSTVVAVAVNAALSESVSGMVDTSNGRVYARRPARYTIDAFVSIEANINTPNKQAQCLLTVNTATTPIDTPSAMQEVGMASNGTSTYAHSGVTVIRPLGAGDYVGIATIQLSGSTMSTRATAVARPHLNIVEQLDW